MRAEGLPAFQCGTRWNIFREPSKNKDGNEGLYCYWAIVEVGYSLAELARVLSMTGQGVGYAVRRRERIAKENNYRFIDWVNYLMMGRPQLPSKYEPILWLIYHIPRVDANRTGRVLRETVLSRTNRLIDGIAGAPHYYRTFCPRVIQRRSSFLSINAARRLGNFKANQ